MEGGHQGEASEAKTGLENQEDTSDCEAINEVGHSGEKRKPEICFASLIKINS